MGPVTSEAEQTARQAHGSSTVHAVARVGLAARGLVWAVIGLLALQVAAGSQEQADQGGALRAIEDQPLGGTLLAVAAAGFVGYAAWLLLSAGVGHRNEQPGRSRLLHRAESLGKGLVYLALAGATVRFLVDGTADDETSSWTAALMQQPGGRTAVGVVAAAVLAIGGYLAVKGVSGGHSDCLDEHRTPRRLRRPAHVVGIVGYVGRGVVLGLVGLFLARAAWQFDAGEARGLDAALQSVAAQSYGTALLALAALGMLAYGLWSFVEAAYREL
jgi:hypothetical protein